MNKALPLLFTYLLASSPVLAAEGGNEGGRDDATSKIRKVSDNMYIGYLGELVPEYGRVTHMIETELWKELKKTDPDKYEERQKKQPAKPYFAAIERVTAENIASWRNYVALERTRTRNTVGLSAFKDIINGNSWETYDLWIAYISSDVRDPFYCNVNLLNQKEKEAYYKSSRPIDMFVTVTMGPRFSTHMGINTSERADLGHRPRGISMLLHSFAARVTLLLRPEALYMITTPIESMFRIIERALPHHVFVGMRGKYRALQESLDRLPPEDSRPAEEKMALIKDSPLLSTFLASKVTKEIGTDASLNPYRTSYFKAGDITREETLAFIRSHPPVLEWGEDGEPTNTYPSSNPSLMIYEPGGDRPIAITSKDTRDDWYFSSHDYPTLLTEFVAVHLRELGELHALMPFEEDISSLMRGMHIS